MPTLKCEVSECANNKEHCCCNNEITISGVEAMASSETKCKNYQPLSEALSSDVREINPSLYINCSVDNCAYNKGQSCTANDVEINKNISSYSKDTQCETFVER